jgi:hypothetical protein
MNFEDPKNQPDLKQKEFESNSKHKNHISNCRSTSTGHNLFIWDCNSEF